MNSFYHPWVGGAETYTSSIARALSDKGHQVTVYCSDRPGVSGVTADGKLEIVRMPTPLILYGTPISRVPPGFILDDYDVIHANFPTPYLAFISALVGSVRGTPMALTWHNDLPPVTFGAGILVRIHDRASPAYLKAYDAIIATTRAYAGRSVTLRRFAHKVTVIHNGVDTTRFNPNVGPDRVRELYGFKDDVVAIFVGSLTRWHSYKGLDILLKAVQLARRERKDLRLLVVGAGALREAYEHLAVTLGIGEVVTFAGYVPDSELVEYYSASDFVVLPSKNSAEGFGLSLLEGMACGKAAIGSRVGGIVEVIDEGRSGILVTPGDPKDLSKGLVLMCDEETRQRMGERGLETARSHDWANVAAAVENLYKKISS